MTRSIVAGMLALAALAASCAPPPEQAPSSVDNPVLGLRIEAVPDGFVVIANSGDTLALAPVGEGVEGRVEVRVGPQETGVNLVAAIHEHQTDIEARPEGIYHGARELEGPLGTAFYSRGSYLSDDGTMVEETLVTAIHPSGDRRLDMVYTYPASTDSGERVTALIGLLAETEGLSPPQG